MAQPSIQSFYRRAPLPPVQSNASGSSRAPGDGFTEAELSIATIGPTVTLPAWNPKTEYPHTLIGDLRFGPGSIKIVGKVVSLFRKEGQRGPPGPGGRPSGFVKAGVRDGSGTVTVKIWYFQAKFEHIVLGSLVSVYTPHVSASEPNGMANTPFVSIIPERDRSCSFVVHHDGETVEGNEGVSVPMGYDEDKRELVDLITLKGFFDGGFELEGVKVLVCVKSVGRRKKVTKKKDSGADHHKIDVIVFDDTGEAVLPLWDDLSTSPATWQPSGTILLITQAGFNDDRGKKLTVKPHTTIDVNPVLYAEVWLRKYAKDLAKKEHINSPFPVDVFDVETALTSELRIKMSLADLEDFARASKDSVIGFVSLIIMEMNLSKLHQRNMMFCEECCSIPIFANDLCSICKHCGKTVTLRFNPRIVGKLSDETGSSVCGKLIFSEEAWEQLLGMPPEKLAEQDLQHIRDREARMLYIRITALMGWNAEVGKTCVLKVME